MKLLKLTSIILMLIFLLVDFSDASKKKASAENKKSSGKGPLLRYQAPVGKNYVESGEKGKFPGQWDDGRKGQPPVGKIYKESGEKSKSPGQSDDGRHGQPPVGKFYEESGEKGKSPAGKFYMDN